jgi:predicted transglutaminase-like cysteine proteinase
MALFMERMMRSLSIICLLFLAGLLFSTATTAKSAGDVSNSQLPQFARATAKTSVPIGWVGFCAAQPAECAAQRKGEEFAKVDEARLRQLQEINQLVNHEIQGIGDNDHYGIYKLGIVNWWTYPDDGKGNCNDYVLLKRKLLIEAGWPRSALLPTVVLDHNNDGHLVLMTRTSDGDLVLDNLTDAIKIWDETGYTFIKRQSADDPNTWLRLETGPTAGELAMINKALASHLH